MKRIVSCILCAVLLIGFLPLCVGAQSQNKIPILHLYGFMSSPIYDENGTRLFPMEKDAVLHFVKKLVPSVSAFTVTNNWSKFGDRLIPAINDLMMPIANDAQGAPQNGTGVLFTYPTAQEIARENAVRFVYDWRDDPFVSASQLNDFITYVTETCGYDRVALECHSYAGIVTLTYLSTYGTDKVQSVCFNATAVYGAAFAGELMRGRVHMSADALASFLEVLFDQKEYEALLRGVVSLVDNLGGIRFLCNFINELFAHQESQIWSESILPIFNNWPSIWAMVPDSMLDDAYGFTRATVRTQNTGDDQIFFSKLERYNREIRCNRNMLLQNVNEDCSLYVIARYGYSDIPLGDIWQTATDGVLDTQSESFGAMCQPFSFLTPTLQPEKLIAPSGTIDASTCLFPAQTWFVRNFKHSQKDPSMDEFTAALLSSPTQLTVDSIKEYPQFLYYDKVFQDLYPDLNQVESFAKWYQDLFRLIMRILTRQWQRILSRFSHRSESYPVIYCASL